MPPNTKFSKEDAELVESMYTSGLPLTATVSDLKKHSMYSGLSSEFSNSTLKRHMDRISKHVAIKEGGKLRSNECGGITDDIEDEYDNSDMREFDDNFSHNSNKKIKPSSCVVSPEKKYAAGN